eukprot:jgi/Chrzof1/4082/Cz13g19160.t1
MSLSPELRVTPRRLAARQSIGAGPSHASNQPHEPSTCKQGAAAPGQRRSAPATWISTEVGCHTLTAGVAGGDAWTWPAMSAEVQSDPDAPSKVFEEESVRALVPMGLLLLDNTQPGQHILPDVLEYVCRCAVRYNATE